MRLSRARSQPRAAGKDALMAKNVLAIIGSYRKGGVVDHAVEAVLAGARDHGAETSKIYLMDQHIEYCRNCRACTQSEGEQRGKCAIADDVPGILAAVEKADAIVLGAPVNYWSVTAVFRTFMERMLGTAYWPWGAKWPVPRSKNLPRKAVLVSSLAAPRLFIYTSTSAPKALRVTAESLGARAVARLFIGMASVEQKPKLSESIVRRAHRIGAAL